jgi:hypothetical protein
MTDTDHIKRAAGSTQAFTGDTRPVPPLLEVCKRLLQRCEECSVTYGHGSFGDALHYDEALRRDARAAIRKAEAQQ